MTLLNFAENLPILLINAVSGWLLAVTLYFHGVKIKPFSCPKCMAFWLSLIYLSYQKYNNLFFYDWYLVFALSLTSGVIAIIFEKWMMKR